MVTSSILHIFVFLTCGWLKYIFAQQFPPNWLTSPYVQADTKDIITSLTNNLVTPTATLTFTNSFNSQPYIAYGISAYQGEDYLGQQFFQVYRTGLNSSSFTVAVQINGTTNIWLMKVRYIAIDPRFPHKLNSFDNVPLNYSNGPLVNITEKSTSLTYYTNSINFTQQSLVSGQAFIQFLTPLNRNKILLFLTSLFVKGTNQLNSEQKNPVNLQIFTEVLTNQTYQINLTSSYQLKITRFHFSMIIFDQIDVISSRMYQLVYERIDLLGTGGFIAIPQQFQTNLIIGLIEFQTQKSRTIIHFNTIFQNTQGGYGINFPQTIPRNNSIYAIRYGFTLFYMKTWSCPNDTVFNIQNNLCENGNICGDGILISSQQCDDGNLIDGDGCSLLCTVETDFTCEPNLTPGILNSNCFYTGQISLNVKYIEKYDYSNQIQILLEIGPKDSNLWKDVDFSKMVTLSNMTGFQSYTVITNSNGTVSIIASYNSSIHNTNITVQLDPSKSGKDALSRRSPVYKQFKVIPNDNQLAVYYDSSVYTTVRLTQGAAYAIAGTSLFVFLIGLFADKLVGIQMMAVIQFSYLSLITFQALNPTFKALADIWFVNGLSVFFFSKDYLLDPYSTNKVKGIYLNSFFVKNYNLTFLLILVPILLALILFILSIEKLNLEKRLQIRQFSKRCICQYAFTGLMFGGYIICVSFVLQLKYGLKNIQSQVGLFSLISCVFMIALLVIYLIIKAARPKFFGQFTHKFVDLYNIQQKSFEDQLYKKKIGRIHYNILIIERIVVGSCLVLMKDLQLSLLFPITIFFLLFLHSLISQPFTKLKHNIRSACNLLITIIILTIYSIYNDMNQPSVDQNIVWIYLPQLICILLLICIIYNAVFIFKALVKKIYSYFQINEGKIEQEQILQDPNKQLMNISSRRKITIENKTEQTLFNIAQHKKEKLQQICKDIRKDYKKDQKQKINQQQLQKYNDI